MFIPPHCPNRECRHFKEPESLTWYRKISPYDTQTFSIDYYAKKRLNHREIYKQINSESGLRNIARNRINRLKPYRVVRKHLAA